MPGWLEAGTLNQLGRASYHRLEVSTAENQFWKLLNSGRKNVCLESQLHSNTIEYTGSVTEHGASVNISLAKLKLVPLSSRLYATLGQRWPERLCLTWQRATEARDLVLLGDLATTTSRRFLLSQVSALKT